MKNSYRLRSHKLLSLSFVLLSLTMILAISMRPLPAAASPQVVFSNPAPINILTNEPLTATPYPSNIEVTGLTGATTKVTLLLGSLSHGRPSDLDLLLVGPNGAKFIVMSDIIGFPVTNISILLDSSAISTLPPAQQNFPGGTWRPTNYQVDSDVFPAPAPAAPYSSPFLTGSATFNSVYNGSNPNGTWSLYVVDDTPGQSGQIASGWSLTVTTSGSPATTFTNSTLIDITDPRPLAAPSAPYPSTINVSGMTGVVSNVKVTLNDITHSRSSDMDVLLVTPNGTGLILMSDSGSAASNVTLTFDDSSPNTLPGFNSGPLFSGIYKPTNNVDGDIGIEVFPEPAPPDPYHSGQLFRLNGYSPNGIWKLYVVDDASQLTGSIAGGWSLDITTTPYVAPPLSCLSPIFAPATNLSTGPASNPTGLATGDFNNDTKQDLVITNQTSNTVSVALGDGAGNFGTPANFVAATNPYAVAVGQFNADSNLDIVVANSGSNSLSLLLGNGAGSFAAPVNFATSSNPLSIAVGDFNNDTKPDVAVANFGGFFAGTVSVLLGNGTGGFSPAVNFAVRTQPSFVAVGNFNADANLDHAVANFGSDNLSILLGNGAGSFTSAPDVTTGSGPVSIAVGDLNADGKADLAVANYNSNNVQVFQGTGTGTFGTPTVASTGSIPISIAITDVNNDSQLDLAIAYRGLNEVRVVFNNGAGVFGQGSGFGSFPVGSAPNAVVTADFNNDGEGDFATANTASDNISVLVNSCAVANGNREDFDGDRRTDFNVYRPNDGVWYIKFIGNSSTLGRLLGNSTDKIVPADYSGDGITDIGVYRPGTGTWIVPEYSTGFFRAYFYYVQFGIATDIPIPADYDGDGRADLAVYRPSDGVWYFRRSLDNSELAVPFGTSEDKPVPADYDGDGKADVAVFRPSTGVWYILQSSDNQIRGEQFGSNMDRPVPADYDGDGKADLAVFRPGEGAWYISQSSNGAFRAQFWGVGTDVPVPGDYDGDGKFDIAVWRPSNGFWYILRSLAGDVQQVNWGTNGDIPAPSAYVF